MRLNSIKLSGFKSFVEPTHFQLPGQLVGVVGPNGCGKSNIMDAVRWVLGESKASELRGESMQDVIFNGSELRKPANRASVELVFSNEDARAGGQWNQFSEIAAKRVLTRDGTSSYYLNNQPVRRRDVQDVFLGTGLGPRTYAVIGQGTISRIIESKPEELRLYLEEAAGVSKYKERRRETETRLEDTREHMTRVDDILRELIANLAKLEAQAEVAERYRSLQASGELKLHQLWFFKHRDATGEQERVTHQVQEATNALESRLTELRHAEAQLESVRQAHYAAGDELHAAQGSLAEASLEVSRIEERIRYVLESRKRIEHRLIELQAQSSQWRERQAQAEQDLVQVDEEIAQAHEQGKLLATQVQEQAARLPSLEGGVRATQDSSHGQRMRVAAVQQQIQVLAAETRNTSEQLRQLALRQERLTEEDKALVAPDETRLAEVHSQHSAAVQAQAQADSVLAALSEQVPALDNGRRAKQEQHNLAAAQQADVSARLDALRALQDKVKTQEKLKPWLAKHGLADFQGLWTRLHIEPGWETALEAALRERISALAVGDIETVRAFAEDAPPARLVFYASPAEALVNTQPKLPRLSELLRLNDSGLQSLLEGWLEGMYRATTVDEAMAQRATLTAGEVIVTPVGHAVSQFAVSFYAPDSEQAGMLARAQEIESLGEQRRTQLTTTEESHGALVRAEAAYTDATQRLAQARSEAIGGQARAHQLQVELLRLTQQAQATNVRRDQLKAELTEIDDQHKATSECQASEDVRFQELDQELGCTQERQAELDDTVFAAERELSTARGQLRLLETQEQEAQFWARTLDARRAELQRGIESAAQQITTNDESAALAQEEIQNLGDQSAQTDLQAALAVKLEREQGLGAKRSAYDGLSAQLRECDENRLELERGTQPLREHIVKLQLEEQAASLGGAQYLEQLSQAQVDMSALAQSIEDGKVKLPGLQGEIDRIHREVESLGAVNLAALEELTQSRERKAFLDAQVADLGDAINTLEQAIRKIDLETRELLKSTFDAVNKHFGSIFPRLFGGGTARLVMTGDEILDAGVQVMAQPPGKKNSTIHLLSGGEKALTAISLVFAIFQLNPAPFCLLDEVDAPLDDANTERYAKLVREMACETQFFFISHNKVAMEMAEQLIGVTMQEQGVSRVVAVDMQAAVSLAEVA